MSMQGLVLLGILMRSSVLVIAAAFVVMLLRSRTAELKHFVCHSVLYGVLFLPAIECIAPPLKHPSAVLMRAELAMFPDQPITSIARSTIPEAVVTITPIRHARRFPWVLLAATLYVFVTCGLLLRLVLSLLRLKHLVNRSEAILNRHFHELGHEIWLQSLSQHQPRIRVSRDVCVPMALGIEEVTILLPAEWALWSRAKLRAALIHEMAHVRRNDPQTVFLASLAVCLFWLNPLVYWLRRKLAALAEEACDEAALLHFNPENYARILIEFAAELGRKSTRLNAFSTAAVHRPLIRRRLERIFSIPRAAQGNHPILRISLIAALVPALYLAASARFDQQQTGTGTEADTHVSISNRQQANVLESELARHSENLTIRGALMAFYANEGNEAAFTGHLLWVINHHPEAEIAGMRFYRRPDAPATQNSADSDHELTRTAWDEALAKYPDSPDVLFHAGLFIEVDDPLRALGLFNTAAALTSADSPAQANYVQAASVIYASAVMSDLKLGATLNGIAVSPDVANELHAEIETSSDPALLSQAGTILVDLRQDDEGLSLIQKAIDLDPANPKWKEALDSAKAEPIRRQLMREVMAGKGGHQVHIGAEVAAAN